MNAQDIDDEYNGINMGGPAVYNNIIFFFFRFSFIFSLVPLSVIIFLEDGDRILYLYIY